MRTWYANRRQGIISSEWRQVCKIDTSEENKDPMLLFKLAVASDFKVDREAIVYEFSKVQTIPQNEKDMWCG